MMLPPPAPSQRANPSPLEKRRSSSALSTSTSTTTTMTPGPGPGPGPTSTSRPPPPPRPRPSVSSAPSSSSSSPVPSRTPSRLQRPSTTPRPNFAPPPPPPQTPSSSLETPRASRLARPLGQVSSTSRTTASNPSNPPPSTTTTTTNRSLRTPSSSSTTTKTTRGSTTTSALGGATIGMTRTLSGESAASSNSSHGSSTSTTGLRRPGSIRIGTGISSTSSTTTTRVGGGTLAPPRSASKRVIGTGGIGGGGAGGGPAGGEGGRGVGGRGVGAQRRAIEGTGSSRGSRALEDDEVLEAYDHNDDDEEEQEEEEEGTQAIEEAQDGRRRPPPATGSTLSRPTSRSQEVVSPYRRPFSSSSSVVSSTAGGGGPGDGDGDPFSLKAEERRAAGEEMVPKRELTLLQTRLSLLERRRAEDRDKLRDLDRLRDEALEWDKVRDKFKLRLETVVREAADLKKENKTLGFSLTSLQQTHDDLVEEVEHSLLDKEIAESELEEERARLKQLEEKVGELEVEVGVFREENARLEGPPPPEGQGGEGDEVSSVAYRQLERQNLRLKDALIRMRDLTTESEQESKKRIEALEKELDLTSDLQGDLDNMAVELEESEAKVEELKAQLDVAAEAQDMLEELTDRNMKLVDDNEELRLEIEDLEALRELADELEESHVETEKQLQEELDLKDLVLQDLKRKNASLEDTCLDYEKTIGQFRDAVVALQSDLSDLREQHSAQATESESLTTQSQAMLDLNLKLKSSALKSQVKAIDLELRKLEARQAGEHLAMVKPYLLPSFFEADADAVNALLFFDRLAFKADLISRFIEQQMPITEALDGVVPDDFVGVCETRTKLSTFASLNKRFSAHLQRCDAETFLQFGRVYRELVPNEKKLDAFVEGLRREELKVSDCGKEVEGLIAQSVHLADTHLASADPLLDLAEREVSCVETIDLDLDTIAAAAGWTKQLIVGATRDPEVEVDFGDANLDDALFKPLQNLVNAARNTKILTKKLVRRFADLLSTSSALSLDHAQGFETLAFNSTAIAGAVAKLSSDVSAYLAESRSSKSPFSSSTLSSILREVVAIELGKQSPRPLEEVGVLLGQLGTDVGTALKGALESESVVKMSYTPPWLARVTALQSTAQVNAESERKVVKLNEELKELIREGKNKDEAYSESLVKISLLEKRLDSFKKQTEHVVRLESDLSKSRKQERTYEEANDVLQRDLEKVEAELAKLRQATGQSDRRDNGSSSPTRGSNFQRSDPLLSTSFSSSSLLLDPANVSLETSTLVSHVSSLRQAIKYLRSENQWIKSQEWVDQLGSSSSWTSSFSGSNGRDGKGHQGFVDAASSSSSDYDDYAELDGSVDGQEPMTPPTSPEPGSTTTRTRTRTSTRTKRLEAPSFVARSNRFLQEVREASASPRLVDVSNVRSKTSLRRGPGVEGGGEGQPWIAVDPTSASESSRTDPDKADGEQKSATTTTTRLRRTGRGVFAGGCVVRDPRSQLEAERDKVKRLERRFRWIVEMRGDDVDLPWGPPQGGRGNVTTRV
ncbi:hypothetical protein JCM10212_006257 [Sporobolomyces blumeae]